MSDLKLPKMPEFKATKSGYEIRADILKQAQDLVAQEFNYKFQGWEMSGKRDDKTGQFVTTVGMPEFPGIEQILSTAERMYAFVNAGLPKK
jgi:hypothetical protein